MAISVVQTVKSNTATTTIASTGSGNTLVVCINSYGTSSPSISSVKLGSTSLTLAESAAEHSGSDYAGSWIYYLSGIASGQTSVAISGTNLGLASSDGGVCIYEVSGIGALEDQPGHRLIRRVSLGFLREFCGDAAPRQQVCLGTADPVAAIVDKTHARRLDSMIVCSYAPVRVCNYTQSSGLTPRTGVMP
jgi:hypothetical protein